MSRKASHTFVFVRGRPFDGERRRRRRFRIVGLSLDSWTR